MITFDRFIKYNRYTKKSYRELMFITLTKLKRFVPAKIIRIIFCFQILPQMVLALFLGLDTFYFHKLELFYKIILIGLLLFIYSYLKYSIRDVIDQWIEDMETEYDYTSVRVNEEGYGGDVVQGLDRVGKTDAIHHFTTVTIKEYIEIMVENFMERVHDMVSYTYVGKPSTRELDRRLREYRASNCTHKRK